MAHLGRFPGNDAPRHGTFVVAVRLLILLLHVEANRAVRCGAAQVLKLDLVVYVYILLRSGRIDTTGRMTHLWQS